MARHSQKRNPYFTTGTFIKSSVIPTPLISQLPHDLCPSSKASLIVISSIMSQLSRQCRSCCNFEQANDTLFTFVLPLKAQEPEHQYRVTLGLLFEQCNRVFADPVAVLMDLVSPDYQLEVIDLRSFDVMRVIS